MADVTTAWVTDVPRNCVFAEGFHRVFASGVVIGSIGKSCRRWYPYTCESPVGSQGHLPMAYSFQEALQRIVEASSEDTGGTK